MFACWKQQLVVERMAMKKGGNWFIVWLITLTATTQGYKSCSELQAENQSEPFIIMLNGQKYNVSCNMSITPAATIVKALNAKNVTIKDPSQFRDSFSYSYTVNYNMQSESINKLVELSEKCQQFVSYRCKNATLFGNKNNPVSSWTTTTNKSKTYWGDCNNVDKICNCDATPNEAIDQGFLIKKQDLPISKLHLGNLNADSEVAFTIGDLVCYGDEQKGTFTFGNLNSFVALNLSSNEKQIEFRFKALSTNRNKRIATIEMENGKHIKVGFVNEETLEISETFLNNTPQTFDVVKDVWNSVKLEILKSNLSVVVNGKERTLVENKVSSTVMKLSFGDPSHSCRTFIGCIKDLKINGKTRTTDLQQSKMKEFVMEGCRKVGKVKCDISKYGVGGKGGVDGGDDGGGGNGGGDGGDGDHGSGSGVSDDDDDDDDDDEDNNNNTAVIVIVVIFLLLLILLLVAFFITWYLKRNKGDYQTHEGSAENVHGDTDNLTLVTRPSDGESEKSKEYYL